MAGIPSFSSEDLAPAVAAWLANALEELTNALTTVDNLSLEELHVEPAKYKNGMLVYADGTNWNPGSGEGVYARQAGAWVKL